LAITDPELVAVEHQGSSITYRELNEKSNKIAYKLASKGVNIGDYIGILTNRSIEMIIGIFGVLKAGAAYMIMDAKLPKSRMEYMLDVSKCKIVLVHPSVESEFSEYSHKIDLLSMSTFDFQDSIKKNEIVQKPTGNDPAYIVFTSGSTGKPKGVLISHGSLCNTILPQPNLVHVKKGERCGQFLNIAFDASIAEIFCTLSVGGTLVLCPENILEMPNNLESLVITPTGLSLLKPNDFPYLKNVVVGGEAITSSLAKTWSHLNLWMSYGPSECTICCAEGKLEDINKVTAGKPTPNTFHYIVDKNMNLVPRGIAGELVIGGKGVGMGYVNRPDLTAERFIANHFANDGSKMYRTGDICRWTEEGEIKILGRDDEMVKVKGYRIELSEVSGVVSNFAKVENCVVQVKDGNLIAYVTPKDIKIELLREFVSNSLAHYMCPVAYVTLEQFPTTANGKIDKAKLLTLETSSFHEEPATETEKQLAQIWSDLLKVEISKIGRQTSFFEIGGDSISAIQLVSKCKDVGLHISTTQVFNKATLSQISSLKSCIVLQLPELQIRNSVIEEIKNNWCPSFSFDDGYDLFPATPLQSGMIAKTLQESNEYLNQFLWEIKGKIELSLLEEAFRKVLIAFPTLRTRFFPISDGIYQVIQPFEKLQENGVHCGNNLENFLAADFNRGFILEDELLIRLGLITQEEQNTTHLVLTIHHVLYDGWSFG
ncbi:hypothetical protein HK099_002064, partial [Clydaea vesicula]